MRPQHITAENVEDEQHGPALLPASMRPQHITAENLVSAARKSLAIHSFNEAAAYHCGKPVESSIRVSSALTLQ